MAFVPAPTQLNRQPQTRSKLSKAVAALVASGASAAVILGTFLNEEEGSKFSAYQDGAKVWTICTGHTGGVQRGQVATQAQCDKFLASDIGNSFALIDKMVRVPMSEPQRAGITSFCTFNNSPSACAKSTFMRKLNAGDKQGACAEINRWVFITVQGEKFDCRTPGNKLCAGIPVRREKETELCML